jgi:hypothetical protein
MGRLWLAAEGRNIMKTKVKTSVKPADGGRWEVVIITPDGYQRGLLCDSKEEAREVARQIRDGRLTQY